MLCLINQLRAATVGKIPDGTQVNVSKEARAAIGKAASVFILYATSWYGISALLFCVSPSLTKRIIQCEYSRCQMQKKDVDWERCIGSDD